VSWSATWDEVEKKSLVDQVPNIVDAIETEVPRGKDRRG
jgi:hypothetical protein